MEKHPFRAQLHPGGAKAVGHAAILMPVPLWMLEIGRRHLETASSWRTGVQVRIRHAYEKYGKLYAFLMPRPMKNLRIAQIFSL